MGEGPRARQERLRSYRSLNRKKENRIKWENDYDHIGMEIYRAKKGEKKLEQSMMGQMWKGMMMYRVGRKLAGIKERRSNEENR